jgi:hypothetical protein
MVFLFLDEHLLTCSAQSVSSGERKNGDRKLPIETGNEQWQRNFSTKTVISIRITSSACQQHKCKPQSSLCHDGQTK